MAFSWLDSGTRLAWICQEALCANFHLFRAYYYRPLQQVGLSCCCWHKPMICQISSQLCYFNLFMKRSYLLYLRGAPSAVATTTVFEIKNLHSLNDAVRVFVITSRRNLECLTNLRSVMTLSRVQMCFSWNFGLTCLLKRWSYMHPNRFAIRYNTTGFLIYQIRFVK